MEVEQGEPADLLAMVAAEEFDQPVGGGDIGPNRVRATASIMSEMARPACRERAGRVPFFR